ncbi:flagellar hook-basal body protein [Salsuginibacillus kocurii]|uniref:flagellar hook-basal body protein n=1 Tax=Salsuginibacillus kocurii TaxID=427078 RepID=UPI00037A7F42|nr:flagellar hook-basal body protein [Salsuginibacillus kocurii]
MLRGFYGAASGMITQQRQTEMLNNNLANAETPGYKGEQGSIRAFPEMLIQAQGTNAQPGNIPYTVGSMNTGVYMQEQTPNFAQGDMRETGNNTDLAIQQGDLPINEETDRPGALFFTVANEDGDVRYTRNGNLTVDGEGFLTTAQGYYVLDEDGDPMNVENEFFDVDEAGNITDEDGAAVGQLNVVLAEQPEDLVKEGDGLFALDDEEAEPLPTAIGAEDVDYTINQQMLEQSNIDPQQAMTDLMQSQRTFESNQTVLQAYDQSMELAVSEVGRLQ